ncbi:MAG: hypothetical protein AAGA60_26060 [Cyanobacteria bacterium P01_E01_bin.42]
MNIQRIFSALVAFIFTVALAFGLQVGSASAALDTASFSQLSQGGTLIASTISGGWSTYNCDITPEAYEVFQEATEGLLGVSYEPVAFATQVVAGTNYRFFSNATVIYPNAPHKAVVIQIYQPLEGVPYITDISDCD